MRLTTRYVVSSILIQYDLWVIWLFGNNMVPTTQHKSLSPPTTLKSLMCSISINELKNNNENNLPLDFDLGLGQNATQWQEEISCSWSQYFGFHLSVLVRAATVNSQSQMCLLKSSFNRTFLGWNAPFCCTFMWTREKHAGWSFGLMVFFLSNETIFGKFYMGLGIVWVMKPREREREMLPNQREEKFQIREITTGSRVGSFFIGFKFKFLF